jgi:hypothetical protein
MFVCDRCLEINVVSEPLGSNGCFSCSSIFALSKYAKIYKIGIWVYIVNLCCNIMHRTGLVKQPANHAALSVIAKKLFLWPTGIVRLHSLLVSQDSNRKTQASRNSALTFPLNTT